MNEQQLQERLRKLKADISLSEREFDKLQDDIQSIQKSKQVAFENSAKEVKKHRDNITILIREEGRLLTIVEEHKRTIAELKEALNQTSRDLASKTSEAEEAVKEIHGRATIRETAVSDREERVKLRENKADIKEQENKQDKESLGVEARRQWETLGEIEKKKKQLKFEQEQANAAVVKAQELLDDITRQTEEKKKELMDLNIAIEKRQKDDEELLPKAREMMHDASFKLSEATRKEEENNEVRKKLDDQRIRLSDQANTLRRAHREVVQRGGNVNG